MEWSQWTREPPTKEGWYWFWEPRYGVRPVRVYGFDGKRPYIDGPFNLLQKRGRWAGPVWMPQAPA